MADVLVMDLSVCAIGVLKKIDGQEEAKKRIHEAMEQAARQAAREIMDPDVTVVVGRVSPSPRRKKWDE